MTGRYDDLEMPVARTTLTANRLSIRRHVDKHIIEDSNMRWSSWKDEIQEGMVLQLEARITTQRITEIQHPADWWQALKERWFPKWALKRWPVRYTRYEVRVYYPDIAIPERQHYVEFYRLSRWPD